MDVLRQKARAVIAEYVADDESGFKYAIEDMNKFLEETEGNPLMDGVEAGRYRTTPSGVAEVFDGKNWISIRTPWHMVYIFMREMFKASHEDAQGATNALFEMMGNNNLEMIHKSPPFGS